MIAYVLVALGGALGSVARFAVGMAVGRAWGEAFPWGTIGINVVGSFVIGCFATLSPPGSANLRAFVMVGLCGGFTTFSAFSLQTLTLARGGAWVAAAANVLLSVGLCLIAVTLGYLAAERLGQ